MLKTDVNTDIKLSRTSDNKTSGRPLEATTHAGNKMNRGFFLNIIASTSPVIFELFTQEY
jgi:hypothetical protein